MTQSTDTELKDLILGMDKKLDSIDAQLTDIKIVQARTDEHLNSIDKRIDGLDKRMDGLDKRMDNIEVRLASTDNRLWTFVGILVTALLGALAKVFLFPQV